MAIQAQFYYEDRGFPLASSQDVTIMYNTCGGFNQFCPKTEKHFQQQQLQNLYEKKKNTSNGHQSMTFPQNLESQIEKQSLEFDRYISLQNFIQQILKRVLGMEKSRLRFLDYETNLPYNETNITLDITCMNERLRWALQEQRQQQVALVLKKYEAKTQYLLGQRDAEIAKAANRTIELENLLKKVEMENQVWQKVAKENEEKVSSLNNTIEQLKEIACLTTYEVEDGESCCDVIENRAGHQVIKKKESAEEITRNMICKGCNFEWSCIIILPCRHLCLCKSCQTFLDSCPVCGVVKKASIEALI